MSRPRYAVVGGGVAGAATAVHLRKLGFDGEIVLITDEPVVPYERPPLSKQFLAGTADADDLRVQPPGWYADQEVDLRLGTRVEALDVAASELRLSGPDGGTGGSTAGGTERLGYDAVVLATGSRPRRLPGIDGERVHYLRTVADSTRLRDQLAAADRIGVLGAGFLGCEVAATAVELGKQVVVFEPDPAPLRRVLGEAVSSALLDIHREHGVDIRAGDYVRELTDTGHGLLLSSNLGGHEECDLVTVGVGARPNVELAAEAGLAIDPDSGGVAVDEYGRTSAPNVYAIGDIAAQLHPRYGRRIRVEHHDTALRQGAHVAGVLLGGTEPFAEAHWFWSDQYEHTIQSVGRPHDLSDLITRGSGDDRSVSAFSLVDGHIQAVISLDRPRDVLDVRRLLFTEHRVTAEQLRDASTPVKRLVPRPARPSTQGKTAARA